MEVSVRYPFVGGDGTQGVSVVMNLEQIVQGGGLYDPLRGDESPLRFYYVYSA
jgi:hypothetical protein